MAGHTKENVNLLDIDIKLIDAKPMTYLFVKATDTHQFLDPRFCHPYQCIKEITYIQALRLNIIFLDNKNFD